MPPINVHENREAGNRKRKDRDIVKEMIPTPMWRRKLSKFKFMARAQENLILTVNTHVNAYTCPFKLCIHVYRAYELSFAVGYIKIAIVEHCFSCRKLSEYD